MKSLLMKFLPFLARMFTGVFAGVIGLGVLIWFGGRFVGLHSVITRLAVIGVVFVVFICWLIGKFLFLKLRGQKLASDLESSVDDDEIRSKLQDVLGSLKTSHLGRRYRGKGALYALPWYMIIGPSAAGKSTFYARSGLNFPFRDDQRYHMAGIGGTKNCDWWFSDQAVLIDTAGRYTAEEDSGEWFQFLKLLKRHRPRVPVNGVILAFPVDELLTSEGDTLQHHANNAKNRLQEIMSELGLMVPVYVVLTKCDMVRGFDSFFEDLSDSESSQPWGVYVLDQTEDKKTDVVQVLKEKLSALTLRLHEQRTQKMLLTQSQTKRADIYQYPSQFSGVSDRIVEFIALLTKDSPYHEKPWFAGVYFTSSMQEGEVIERRSNLLKDVFAKALNLTKRTGSGQRSYFISELFTQVIFPLKDAVRGNRSRQRVHLAAKSLLLLLFLTVGTGLGLALTGTYTANQKLLSDYVNKAQTLVGQLQNPQISEIERLHALLELHQHYQDLESISTYSPLSLFSRYDLIGTHGEPMRDLLVQTLESAVVDQIVPHVQVRFARMSGSWKGWTDQQRSEHRLAYYEYLKVYQMLTNRPEQYERDVVAPFLAQQWFQRFQDLNLPLSETDLPRLTRLTEFYLQHVVETVGQGQADYWAFDDGLVNSAQADLMTPPDADLLYGQMASKGMNQYRNITLRSLLGPDMDGVLSNSAEFSGIYSRKAWDNYVKAEIAVLAMAASQGDWVLGLEQGNADEDEIAERADRLERDIRKQYFTDYVAHWRGLLTGTRAVTHENLATGIQALKSISESEGVLFQLFDHIQNNLQISDIARVEVSAAAVSNTDAGKDSAQQVLQPPLNPVFAAISQELRSVLRDADDSGASDLLEQYLAEVAPLAEELDAVRVASDADQEARRYAGDLLSGNGGNKRLYSAWINVDNLLQDDRESIRKQTTKLFTSPLVAIWNGLLAASERSLQSAWQETVYQTYNGAIRGRYPFSESGSDAAVRDVTQFFNPDAGLFWQFINDDLKPFVQVRSGNWKVRRWLGQGLAFDPDVFSAVNSAGSIVNGLFDKQSTAGMRYWVSPVPTPGVSESILSVDDHVYQYRNEPEEWREFQWSLENSQFAEIQVHLNGGAGYADMSFEGPWAFIKLLRHSDITHAQGTEFNVSIPLKLANGQEVRARYSVRADRAGSVLNERALQSFYLPKNLFKG